MEQKVKYYYQEEERTVKNELLEGPQIEATMNKNTDDFVETR